MKKTALTFLSISLLLAGSSILGNAINSNNYLKHFSPVANQAQEVKSEEVAPKGELQEFFAKLQNNNFTLSYRDHYVNYGQTRTQVSKYTAYSLESSGDLGFNGYAQNEECVFTYKIENNTIVSGVPLIDYNHGIMVNNIYDYREGLNEFDYSVLPSDYIPGSTFEYEFGKNTKNDALLIAVFLRATYNPDVLPKSLTMQVVGDNLNIHGVKLDYGEDIGQDTVDVTVLDVGTTENTLIKKYLDEGKGAKTPLDRKFFFLIAPYLQSYNYKTRLDATELLRSDLTGKETFVQDQYFLDEAMVYDTLSDEDSTVTGEMETIDGVVNFKMADINADKLDITSTVTNTDAQLVTSLYGEFMAYTMADLQFSNWIGYIDENDPNSYYITDSQTQSILGYIAKYELDSTTRSLRSLKLTVTDWDKHEFDLIFEVYNPTTNKNMGKYKTSFSNVDEVEFKSIDRYLNYGERASDQERSELESVLNKFKGHNYTLDIVDSGTALAKIRYTPNYYYSEAYGNPNNNLGYIKLGEKIHKFTIDYSGSEPVVNVETGTDYAEGGMKLPGCGEVYGSQGQDLFYVSAFDDVIYDYDSYEVVNFYGYSFWSNTASTKEGTSNFANDIYRYFYPNDTKNLPQYAGFMVSDSEDSYDTRCSLIWAYSSKDGTQFGMQLYTFYDIGKSEYNIIDNYLETQNS